MLHSPIKVVVNKSSGQYFGICPAIYCFLQSQNPRNGLIFYRFQLSQTLLATLWQSLQRKPLATRLPLTNTSNVINTQPLDYKRLTTLLKQNNDKSFILTKKTHQFISRKAIKRADCSFFDIFTVLT